MIAYNEDRVTAGLSAEIWLSSWYRSMVTKESGSKIGQRPMAAAQRCTTSPHQWRRSERWVSINTTWAAQPAVPAPALEEAGCGGFLG